MSSEHLSQLQLSHHLCEAEVPDTEKEHLTQCRRCREELETLFAAAEQFTPRPLHSPSRINRRFGWTWLLIPTVAIAALLLFWSSQGKGIDSHTPPIIATKGQSPQLSVIGKRGDAVFAVRDGAILHPKDMLRFVVRPEKYRHVLIAGRDGKGHVQMYAPFGGETSADIAAGKEHTFAGSIVLDDVEGQEIIAAFFSTSPFSAQDIREYVSAGKPSEAFRVQRISFSKEPKR